MYKLTVVLQSSVLHYTLPALEVHWELFSCLAFIPASNIKKKNRVTQVNVFGTVSLVKGNILKEHDS